MFSNNSIYSGLWKDNKMDGTGKYIWLDDKQLYEGEIKKNKKEG
jgi:hypothetical protein